MWEIFRVPIIAIMVFPLSAWVISIWKNLTNENYKLGVFGSLGAFFFFLFIKLLATSEIESLLISRLLLMFLILIIWATIYILISRKV